MPEQLSPMKKRFPFRLGTTSYIVPAAAIPNIRFLGPYVDEIELLLFESTGEYSLPSTDEIREMGQLASEFDLVYNVHLPTDVFSGDPDPAVRDRFKETILRFIDRTAPLNPTTCVLHCESENADGSRSPDRQAWLDRTSESLEKLVDGGIDPRRIALENLDYPPETVLPLADRFGMHLCLDIGHMLRGGFELAVTIRQYLARCSMVHLHGVKNGKDHVGVQWIPDDVWDTIRRALGESYSGGVSLEVFSLKELIPSLQRMEIGITSAG